MPYQYSVDTPPDPKANATTTTHATTFDNDTATEFSAYEHDHGAGGRNVTINL